MSGVLRLWAVHALLPSTKAHGRGQVCPRPRSEPRRPIPPGKSWGGLWVTGGQAAVTTSGVRGLSWPSSVSFRLSPGREARLRDRGSVWPQCPRGPVWLWPRGSRHSHILESIEESGPASLCPSSLEATCLLEQGVFHISPHHPRSQNNLRLQAELCSIFPALDSRGRSPSWAGSKPCSAALAERGNSAE